MQRLLSKKKPLACFSREISTSALHYIKQIPAGTFAKDTERLSNKVVAPPPEEDDRVKELPTDTIGDKMVKDSILSINESYQDFYDKYMDNLKPVLRGTDEVRLGRKYIGMVALPKYFLSAIDQILAKEDKKLLSFDTLRIRDSIYSLDTISLEQIRKDQQTLLAKNKGNGKNKDKKDVNKSKTSQDDESDEKLKPSSRKRYSILKPEMELTPHTLEYGHRESHAYLASRFPSSFGVLSNIFSEISKRATDFTPKRMLDFGCGPGTALWSANEVWGDKIHSYHGVDISEHMLRISESLANFGRNDIKASDLRFERHLSPPTTQNKYNLVVCSFTLSELPSDDLRKMVVESLWEQTDDTLVLVEYGNPIGSKYISDARNYFLSRIKNTQPDKNIATDGNVDILGSSKNADSIFHFVAPCPHEKTCPLDFSSRFCHFSQRIQRPRLTKIALNTKENEDDQHYTYLVIRRGPRPNASIKPSSKDVLGGQGTGAIQANENTKTTEMQNSSYDWSRVILPALKKGGHVVVDVCSKNGATERKTYTKSFSKQSYRDSRKVQWGDLFPHEAKTTVPILVKHKKR